MKRLTLTLGCAFSLGLVACGGMQKASAPESAAAPGAHDESPAREVSALDAPAPAAPPPAAEAAEEDRGGADGEAEMAAAAPAPASAARRSAPMAKGAASGGTIARRPRPAPPALVQAGGVRAGEWDDNANFRDFQKFLGLHSQLGFTKINVAKRRFIVVEDDHGRAVPNCRVTLRDNNQRTASLTTTASGRAIAFPAALGLSGKSLFASTRCLGTAKSTSGSLEAQDGMLRIRLDQARSLPQQRTVDIAFVLDTTGSMSEEIRAVKDTLNAVANRLDNQNVNVRVGMVEYKDRTDAFVTKVYPMSSNVKSFARKVSHISASGGGDTPEDMNTGLSKALSSLQWNDQSMARLVFVIADAPPHLDYQNTTDYSQSVQQAARRGIKIHTIAASGMDTLGQVVFRQIAQYTGGNNMFVLRGGAGPQSTGGGDAKSGCGGTHQNYSSGNLDQLIVSKIQGELASLDQSPTRIAGLGQDEKAKPCDQRLVVAQ